MVSLYTSVRALFALSTSPPLLQSAPARLQTAIPDLTACQAHRVVQSSPPTRMLPDLTNHRLHVNELSWQRPWCPLKFSVIDLCVVSISGPPGDTPVVEMTHRSRS